MPVRASGNLIIGGQIFKIDAPVVNWHESGWDSTSEFCLPTHETPNPGCVGGKIPYGNLPLGPYTKRYSTRPA